MGTLSPNPWDLPLFPPEWLSEGRLIRSDRLTNLGGLPPPAIGYELLRKVFAVRIKPKLFHRIKPLTS
jgi:hypothetical protein